MVRWSDAITRFYAITKYDELTPFHTVRKHLSGGEVEARLLGKQFHAFEINGDLRTDTLNFTFSNTDRVISNLFQEYGEGIDCELFYFYPEIDELISVWWGQLNNPTSEDYEVLPVTATNGFMARETTIGRRNRAGNCQHTFGGLFTSAQELETNDCPYNKHLGGTEGIDNPATSAPFTSCPKVTEGDCAARFGHSRYFGGFKWTANAIVSDGNTGYISKTTKNGSHLKTPIRVIAGAKHVKNPNILLFAKEVNAGDPEKGFVRGIVEIGEGPCQQFFNLQINEKNPQAWSWRNGTLGQPALSQYGAGVSNFSGTAHFFFRYGWTDAQNTTPQSLSFVFACHGYDKVAVFTDTDTYTRIWTNSRVWWLLEFYTNKVFGRFYSHSRFDIDSFLATAEYQNEQIRFTHPNPDAETQYFDFSRDLFDAVIEGRPSAEVLGDICRAGRLSVPFQSDGKYKIKPLKILTPDELENVFVFYDTGENRNILYENDLPTLKLSAQSDKTLPNELVLTFEDAANLDIERPVTVDDSQQKLKAGKAFGTDALTPVIKNEVGFGIRDMRQAVKTAYGLLWFGEFDEGGTRNNLRATFKIWFEQSLALEKYDVIKIESERLIGKGFTDEFTGDFTQFEYFRILSLKKLSDNTVEVTAQAYNHVAMANFETEIVTTPPPENPTPGETPPFPLPLPIPGEIPIETITYEDGFLEITLGEI